jgi:hypothetical protein
VEAPTPTETPEERVARAAPLRKERVSVVCSDACKQNPLEFEERDRCKYRRLSVLREWK